MQMKDHKPSGNPPFRDEIIKDSAGSVQPLIKRRDADTDDQGGLSH